MGARTRKMIVFHSRLRSHVRELCFPANIMVVHLKFKIMTAYFTDNTPIIIAGEHLPFAVCEILIILVWEVKRETAA